MNRRGFFRAIAAAALAPVALATKAFGGGVAGAIDAGVFSVNDARMASGFRFIEGPFIPSLEAEEPYHLVISWDRAEAEDTFLIGG